MDTGDPRPPPGGAAKMPFVGIQALVLDIGGVVEFTPATGWTARWERALGLRPGEIDERLDDVWRAGSLGAITEEQVHRRVRDRLGLSPSQLSSFMHDAWTEYLGTLNDDMVSYLRGLRPRYRIAFLSNSFVGAREREAEHYGFDTLVDLVVYSHEEGRTKPDPRIYQLACDRLGVQPEEAIFVDDHPDMLAGAVAVGMRGILFETTPQTIAAIEAILDE